jgi:hypothetical protein
LGYPTPAHGQIPSFSSIEEEAEFWDTHSFVDYVDDFESLDRVSDESALLPVPVVLDSLERVALERIARNMGVLPSSLMRTWIEERLDHERKAS